MRHHPSIHPVVIAVIIKIYKMRAERLNPSHKRKE